MTPLFDFAARVSTIATPDDVLLPMCRSGGRSAIGINMLAQAGFKNVYNIIDGMEGDTIDDPRSVFFGQHMVNGWKNSGLPWTFEMTPVRLILPKAEASRSAGR